MTRNRAAAMVLLMLCTCLPPALAGEPVEMSAATLVAHGADRVPPIVIDARTPEEFAAGHLPGAINVPHATVETAVGSLMSYRTREVVVYCHSGRRARIVIDALAAKGFTHLSHLTGDFPVWQGEGRPVSR